jgi:hypothetical protein
MLMLFTCEHCGKRIQVDARMQGRRGRCSHCGQEMRIPRVDASPPPPLPGAGPVPSAEGDRAAARGPARTKARPREPSADGGFRLSPPEPRPEVSLAHFQQPPVLTEPEHLHRIVGAEPPSEFELLSEDGPPGMDALASPQVQRGLRELEEFRKDPSGYQLAEELDSRFFGWLRGSRPAGWVYTQWRKGVGLILRLLRFVTDWAYLISVPFLILMVFAIAIGHRWLIHTGAVVVVLVNIGRFWTDLLSLFVRPFKDGPMHGLMFLFPPYGFYYVVSRWDKFKPTFRRLGTSCIPIVLVALAYIFIPAVDPDVQSARTLPEKARRAEQDFVKDARELGREVRQEVQSLEKRALPRPRASE